MQALLSSLRPQQWIKNAFIFMPLVFSKQLTCYPHNLYSVYGFILFSLASSSVYLINDIIDVDQDRLHPTKKLRPFAAGKIGKTTLIIAIIILSSISMIGAFLLNKLFLITILVYFILNIFYSRHLKNVVILDVFCIGVFFILRALAGSFIAEVEISHWILTMTGLLALFLGFNKRRQELENLKEEAFSHRTVLKKYSLYFIDQMIAVITSSIVIAYMLYTIDQRTLIAFGGRQLICTAPFVYYGIFRYMYLIHKVKKEGDPTKVLLSDKIMQVNIILWFLFCIVFIYLS